MVKMEEIKRVVTEKEMEKIDRVSFNPYSNGSSFFIQQDLMPTKESRNRFNPYSNGSSFFIKLEDIRGGGVDKFQSLF